MDDSAGAELPVALRIRTGFAIIRLAADFRRRLSEELAPLGVSQHQHAILCCLAEFGPAFQKDVAARLGIDTGDTVALVEALERTGLITRQRDPRDRRRQILELTELGTATLVRIEAAVDEVERDTLITLSDQDRAALHDGAVRALTHHAPLAWPADDISRPDPSQPQPPAQPNMASDVVDVATESVAQAQLPGASGAGQFADLVRLLTAVPRAAIGAGRSLLVPLKRRSS